MSVKFLIEESKRLIKQAQDECPHPTINIYVGYYRNETCQECGLTGQDIRNKTPPKTEDVTPTTEEKPKKRKFL